MEYSILDLIKPINNLNNIGIKTLDKLNKHGIELVIDLLFYLPINISIRKRCNNINSLIPKELCIIKLTPIEYIKTHKTTKVICVDDDNQKISLIFFNLYKNYLDKYLPLNVAVVIIGTPDVYKGNLVINHPEKILHNTTINSINTIEPIYRAYQDISTNKFKMFIQEALQILNNTHIPEWLNNDIIKRYNLPSFIDAVNNIHNPTDQNVIDPYNPNMLRLCIDEMLCYHLILMKSRQSQNHENGISIVSNNNLIKPLLKNLPFKLTLDQIEAIKEIKKDLSSNKQTSILLQGDVGSGKTIVCFIASLFAVENNYQVAFMAPTEILALQHFNNLKKYANILNINIEILRAKDTQKNKQTILNNLKNNTIKILIGTHSIFQKNVEFNNLGLVIIDEQHKFGVNQRIELLKKGNNPNLILTTATPIPRSLVLGLYGDIKSLEIKEKPQNRKDIITQIINQNKIEEIFSASLRALNKKEKIFWVCPLVEENDKLDLMSVNERFNKLKELFPQNSIYLVHGKLKPQEKDNIVNEFKNNHNGSILVATSVIEVGIDIPSCNIIIIENSERFGLAQLHQLRGRVGRGDAQGVCLLIYSNKASISSKNRLSVLKNSNDGFFIAQEDLKIRGYGDILGTNQSGYDYFKLANLQYHNSYLIETIQIAKFIYNKYENDVMYKNKLDNLLKIFNKYQEFYLKV